jgi:hypothetical protein
MRTTNELSDSTLSGGGGEKLLSLRMASGGGRKLVFLSRRREIYER